MRALSVEMDKGNYNHTDYGEVHIISSLLKKFLKELPDPLIPGGMYDDFISCGLEKDEEQRMTRMKELVYSLPIAHYHTLKFLMTHLKNITAHSDVNKVQIHRHTDTHTHTHTHAHIQTHSHAIHTHIAMNLPTLAFTVN